LRETDWAVAPGACWLLTGPSGGGKSTLLRLLNRLLDPGAGRLLWQGKVFSEYAPPALRARLLLVPQEPVFGTGPVGEQLLRPWQLRVHRARARPERAALRAALDALRLEDVALEHDAATLSVGQRMRLALARALLLGPEVLLLDEPAAGLDEVSRAALEAELARRHAAGLTLVIVSHAPLSENLPGLRRASLANGRLAVEPAS
jgi:putative ABC transport system ATP-binding protein